MARGMPSRAEHKAAKDPAFESVTWNAGAFAQARSIMSWADSLVITLLREVAPAAGFVSGRTRYVCSALIPSGRRLVARKRTSGRALRRCLASEAGPAPRCSQLSSTTSSFLPLRKLTMLSFKPIAGLGGTARADANARSMANSSSTEARSTNQTPSVNSPVLSAAA